jgi:hypothetical protein
MPFLSFAENEARAFDIKKPSRFRPGFSRQAIEGFLKMEGGGCSFYQNEQGVCVADALSFKRT